MRCTSPRTVGFLADGKTIAWSQKKFDRQYPSFQLPCGKCISCRLDYAREWAVRCVHEAQMHPRNSFITLTYKDECLGNNRLDYRDFQLFMKKVRNTQNEPIGFFATGEYGEKTKRKHWHAILFNYEPRDSVPKYKTPRGDQVFESKNLGNLWGNGIAEFGSVTFESAGYCARYSAKKLVHGKDEEHEFKPVSKKSSKHAIGKKWLEQFWPDVFSRGRVVLPNGVETSVPRYYEKWLKKNYPQVWIDYVTETKFDISQKAESSAEKKKQKWEEINSRRLDAGKTTFINTENEDRKINQDAQFKLLQSFRKL